MGNILCATRHASAPSAMYSMDPPSLPFEVLEDVLTVAVRITLDPHKANHASSAASHHPSSSPYLNALPRATIPAVSRAALKWASLDLAARLGNLWMLDSLVSLRHGSLLAFTRDWLLEAAKAGHVHVFEWWYSKSKFKNNKSGDPALPIQCDLHGIMDAASGHGHVEVLQWWKVHVLDSLADAEEVDYFYSAKAVDDASQGGHVECLNWWLKESGLPIKYTSGCSAIQSALEKRHHKVLKWWTLSGLLCLDWFSDDNKLVLTKVALESKDLRGFKWLVTNNLASFVDMTALCALKTDPQLAFFHACAALVPGGSLTAAHFPNPQAFLLATKAGRVDMLNHLRTLHELPHWTATGELLQAASETGHVHVLDWWLTATSVKLNGSFSKRVLVGAAANGHVRVLKWWSEHSLVATSKRPLDTYPMADVVHFDAINQAAANGHLRALKWLWMWRKGRGRNNVFTAKEALVCYHALMNGHAVVIRWAATKSGFEIARSRHLCKAMYVATRMGYREALEAYVVDVCHLVVHTQPVESAEEEHDQARDSGGEKSDRAWWEAFSYKASDGLITESLIRASRRGDLGMLEWWGHQLERFSQRVRPHVAQTSMCQASLRGHVAVLQWWHSVSSRLVSDCEWDILSFQASEVFPNKAAVDPAVLKWWMNSRFRFSEWDVCRLFARLVWFGQVRLLEMCLKELGKLIREGLDIDIHPICFAAAASGQVAVLDWWWKSQQQTLRSNPEALIKTFRFLLLEASENSQLHILDWWRYSSGIAHIDQVPFSSACVEDWLSDCPDAWNWWLNSGMLQASDEVDDYMNTVNGIDSDGFYLGDFEDDDDGEGVYSSDGEFKFDEEDDEYDFWSDDSEWWGYGMDDEFLSDSSF